VVSIIVYFIVTYVYGKATIQDISPDKFDLGEGKTLYSSDDTQKNILAPGGSTIMAFINVNIGERTGTADGNYQSLIGVNGAFSLDISPTSTQLTVVTKNGGTVGGDNTVQTIEIPALPLQKWVFVTILRDGRRFDIMYDDQVVASHRFDYFPKTSILQPLIIGNKTLLGTGIHVIVAPYRLTPTQVSQQRAKLADMNGKPVGTDTAFGLPPIPFTSISSICLPGMPCNRVSNPPGDALKAWSTPFS
jgi:hypothetical protein